MNFGYEGLGLFYAILEKIAKQEKPVKTEVLKTQLRVGKKLEKCWGFMEEIGIIQSNNGETFNERLLNYSEKYQIKKEKTRIKISEWREKQKDTKNVTGYKYECNTPKVKESKVKENELIKNKYAENVLLTDDEYKKLVEKHGEHWTKKMIEKLDNYKGAHGKKYKSDYKAILSWVIDEVKKLPEYGRYIIEREKKKQRSEQLKQSDALAKLRQLHPEIEKINKYAEESDIL